MKLNVKALALACGILWSAVLLLITWWIILWEGQTYETTMFGRVYLGYNISFVGSLIGFLWAFVDGLIAGAVIAWLYNRFS